MTRDQADREKRGAFEHKNCAAVKKMAKMKSQKGDKRGAMLCLKRKKMYQKEVDKIMNIVANLEQQKFALENAASNAVVVGAMTEAKDKLQEIHKGMDADTVVETMDDIQEQMDTADEIVSAFGQQVGDTYDDDELLGELDEMEKDLMEEEMLNDNVLVEDSNAVDQISMPNVPSQKPTVQDTEDSNLDADEEAAFNNLMAEMQQKFRVFVVESAYWRPAKLVRGFNSRLIGSFKFGEVYKVCKYLLYIMFNVHCIYIFARIYYSSF